MLPHLLECAGTAAFAIDAPNCLAACFGLQRVGASAPTFELGEESGLQPLRKLSRRTHSHVAHPS